MLHCRESAQQRAIAGILVPWEQQITVAGRGEEFMRGAFDDQFRDELPAILLHYQHNTQQVPIGRLAEAADMDDGLWGEFAVHRGPAAQEAWHAARDGVLTGFSIGFTVPSSSGPGGQGTVRKAEIDHVALTHQPAYGGAVVQEARRMRSEDVRALLDRRVRRLAAIAR